MYSSRLAENLVPYVAGEQIQNADIIKLNTNENPYPPSPAVEAALKNIDYMRLRLYNDPNNTALRAKIAAYEGVNIENVFVGNGSDEVLAMAFPAFATTGASFADVTYSFYEVYCNFYGLKAHLIPVKEDLRIDIKPYYHAKGELVVVCNPNAPTGQLISQTEIEHIIRTNKDKVVLVDEAYAPFSMASSVPLTKQNTNLLIVKTFSKAFSLAGIRCGYAIGDKELIDTLNKIKNSFNSYTVNAMTEQVAMAALEDAEYTRIAVESVISTRALTTKLLKSVGFNVLPSDANFVFAKHEKMSAKYIYESLKERGILVRYFNKPKIDSYLRITIGTPEQMYSLFRALTEIIEESRF